MKNLNIALPAKISAIIWGLIAGLPMCYAVYIVVTGVSVGWGMLAFAFYVSPLIGSAAIVLALVGVVLPVYLTARYWRRARFEFIGSALLSAALAYIIFQSL